MAFSFNSQVLIGAFLLVALSLSGVFGHSYVTSPQSRSNQAQTNAGCRGPACLGPCEIPLSARRTNAAVHAAKRGDSITIQWPRNNHAGGFIRFAWAPTAQSDNATYFDNHVQQINCHEVGGCSPDDPSNPNGGDTGPADGSSRACRSTLTVPADLADGKWTLQWSWFGGAFALGDYYSCVDYSIAGGDSGPTPAPVFKGGDYSFPNQNKCKFFNTDRLHVCVNEPCTNPIYPATQQQSGPPAYVQKNYGGPSNVGSTSTSASVPATPAAPATTGAMKPSTTGAAKPSTTGTATRPAPTPTPTPTPAPVSPPTSSCTSGHMKCLTQNTYSMCNFGVWGPSQSCASGTGCSPNGDYIYCLASAPSTPSVPSASSTSTGQSAAPTPTPSVPSTPSSGVCTKLGSMMCVSQSSYQTCSQTRTTPVWSQPQNCPSGLKCSPNGDYIFCL